MQEVWIIFQALECNLKLQLPLDLPLLNVEAVLS